jgi:Rieske Fe-S protein
VPRAGGFEDPCGGATFALDGRCVSGPCPRNLDEFPIVEDSGATYVDLTHVVRGAPAPAQH